MAGIAAVLLSSSAVVGFAPTWRGAARRVDVRAAAEEGAWLPVCSVSGMRGLGPQRVEVCGQEVVVWEGPSGWSTMVDECPHKLAPLSQGRVDPETGCLECPYHGWQFDGDGETVRIPQGAHLAGSAPGARALPTYQTNDLLWAFFDSRAVGRRDSIASTPDVLYPKLVEEQKPYYARTLPYSFDILIENFMDPAHIPYAHHGLQGVRDDGSPIPMTLLASNETHVEASFQDTVRAKPRTGIVSFRAPSRYHFRCKEADGNYDVKLEMYCVPVGHGRSRVFFSTALASKLPIWLAHAATNRFLNTDIWLHDAERKLRADDLRDERLKYASLTSSDVGSSAWRSWWRENGMARAPPHTFGPAPPGSLTLVDRKTAIDPWANHAVHCSHCRAAVARAATAQKFAIAVALAAIALPIHKIATLAISSIAASVFLVANKVKAMIRGELDPVHVADRSVAHTDKPTKNKPVYRSATA